MVGLGLDVGHLSIEAPSGPISCKVQWFQPGEWAEMREMRFDASGAGELQSQILSWWLKR